MKTFPLGNSSLIVPAVAVGCMRIQGLSADERKEYIRFCVDNGLNFFDNADIYGRGECEQMLGEALHALGIRRDDVIIQSKCGIVPGKMYDSSKEHILAAVDGILRRLGTDYLDLLAIHRPDALVEPSEVAEAFDRLYVSGKVRHFGVSNHNPMQMELLKKYVKQPLIVNQLQFSLTEANMVACGTEVNMTTDNGISRDGYVLDYCRLHDITVQAWSPFMHGFFKGVFIGDREHFPVLNDTLDELAAKYGVTPTGIAAAWILRHPANIQMIAGTTKISRLQEILDGAAVTLDKEDWYRLYRNAGHILP